LKKGLTAEAAEIMLNSITESTMKQYKCSLKQWWKFTQEEKYDIFNTDANKLIEFLTQRFQNGAKYGTLNSDRAAVAIITSKNISEDRLVSRFMRGVFKKRPTRPKYATTWNTDSVLQYIEMLPDTDQLRMKDLAEKTATLLMLATAQRLQTLALINIDNIKMTKSGIEIKIPEIIKTSRPGACQPNLILPFFKEKRSLCVARTLLEYMDYTKDLRGMHKSLFITTVKPHKPVSTQTLGHWIKAFLKKSGVNTDEFTAYSTKHAAVSKASSKGVNIDTIRRTAGWSERSKIFGKFYNRPI
ncbi:hypothetical protein EAG_02774, partial [Camponotus floridanus]